MLRFFANFVWINFPAPLQIFISKHFSTFFRSSVSKYIIVPYCLFFGIDFESLQQFEPAGENLKYTSYSDFFTRKYKAGPKIRSSFVWPCEGYVCDWGWFKEKRNSVVKGTRLDLNLIFQSSESETKDHYFTNIFLHNHNYHRVHSPSDLRVEDITSVPGHLNFLRPWLYKRDQVSYPALRNERVIIRLSDSQLNPWYIALIGGFGVGTIELNALTKIGAFVKTGQELGHFNLGSTVCLATPFKVEIKNYLQVVNVGQDLVGYDLKLKNEVIENVRIVANTQSNRDLV